ncbi:MAG: SufD family Fe-S cluster assembly protein [Candidatus Thermoplasmatota archaeon]|nr:SufD family Fe-S cluster assembly protein [Candidatus Thermoplasmatota archaeon]MCL5731496.1 SufD family Fe-S cluster assembly protein [Candidatus Thermoplasmatota archaeon]
METFADILRDRFGNSAYGFRLESFKNFLRSRPRSYKESPTTKDYVSITDTELEKLLEAGSGEAESSFAKTNEREPADVAIYDGKLKEDREISGILITDLNSVACSMNRGSAIFERYGKGREEHLINAAWENGYYLEIPDFHGNVTLNISNILSGSRSLATKSYIACGAGNTVNITDSYTSLRDNSNTFGRNIYIEVGQNSRVVFNYIQGKEDHSTDITFIRSYLSEGADFRIYHLNYGSSKVLFYNESEMMGDNSTFRTFGVNLSRNDQQMDIMDSSFQTGKSTHANIQVKGAVTDSSITMHRGNIDIEEKSIQSTGFYDSKLLLLSEKAYANSKPALVIKNNNTRSKHGSAISSVDQDEIFYLQSRGIDRKNARTIITEGFLSSYLEQSGSDIMINKVHELAKHIDL